MASSSGIRVDQQFDSFYKEVCASRVCARLDSRFARLQVKEIEKRDSAWTSEGQLTRLLRPGSAYFNLNPFEVVFAAFGSV